MKNVLGNPVHSSFYGSLSKKIYWHSALCEVHLASRSFQCMECIVTCALYILHCSIFVQRAVCNDDDGVVQRAEF